jgi:hypothetical protein
MPAIRTPLAIWATLPLTGRVARYALSRAEPGGVNPHGVSLLFTPTPSPSPQGGGGPRDMRGRVVGTP